MLRLRSNSVARTALSSALAKSPAHLMDFLTFAVTGAAAEGAADRQLLSLIQQHADSVSKRTAGLPMCHPDVRAATRLDGDMYLLGAQLEEESHWARLALRAHVRNSDILLPVAAVAATNAAFALLHWWVAVALLPGVFLATGFLSFVWARQANPFAPLPQLPLQSRSSMVAVIALLAVGACLFVFNLVPELGSTHPRQCATLAAAFVVNAWAFHRTVTADAGMVPRGSGTQGAAASEERVCLTCACVRPLRSKHDPFSGRCVHAPPARGNARGALFHPLTLAILFVDASENSITTARW